MQEILDNILCYLVQFWNGLTLPKELFLYNAQEPIMFSSGLFVFLFAAF
jgi:hypothetical protein